MMRIICVSAVFAAVFAAYPPVFAAHLAPESWYQKQWCEGRGLVEYVLEDMTRVDCLTATHAIEFDFGSKWAEAIGQALYYSSLTGKRAGVVLIIESPGESRYLRRLNTAILYHNLPIDVWTVGYGAAAE